jgi:predicted transglutaminase-like cysteine proteinase
VEFWTYPDTGAGDCEDYALEKRRALIELGWPPRALRFGVATSPETGRHAVLVVRTDKGDLVLDNLNPYIVSWGSTRYEWVSLQSGEDPMVWHAAGPGNGTGSGLATASSRGFDRR